MDPCVCVSPQLGEERPREGAKLRKAHRYGLADVVACAEVGMG